MWALAWPTIVMYLITTLTSLVVIKIVSGLGTPALAAVVAGQRVFFVFQAVLMGLSAGSTAMVARAWGAKNPDKAIIYTRLSMLVGLALAIFLGTVFISAAPVIATFFGLAGESYSQAVTYIRWLNVFNPGFAVFILLSAIIRSTGNARLPLYISVVTNLLVALLTTLMTYGMAGFPPLGIAGAAIGAGIGYTLGALFFFVLWWRGKLQLGFHPATPDLSSRLKSLLTVSYPAATEQCVIQGALIMFLWIVAQYGPQAFAAYGIGLSLLSVTMVVGMGFSIAGATLVGQHLGAGDSTGAIACGYRAMRLTMFYMTLCGALVIYFAHPLARLLVDDSEVVRLSAIFITFLGLVQPMLAIDFALGGALRGAGDTRFPLLATFCGFVGVRLVLAYLFMSLGLPVEWVYSALIGDYTLKAGLLIWRFRSRRWLRALPS